MKLTKNTAKGFIKHAIWSQNIINNEVGAELLFTAGNLYVEKKKSGNDMAGYEVNVYMSLDNHGRPNFYIRDTDGKGQNKTENPEDYKLFAVDAWALELMDERYLGDEAWCDESDFWAEENESDFLTKKLFEAVSTLAAEEFDKICP